jgi:hypothetical protein
MLLLAICNISPKNMAELQYICRTLEDITIIFKFDISHKQTLPPVNGK